FSLPCPTAVLNWVNSGESLCRPLESLANAVPAVISTMSTPARTVILPFGLTVAVLAWQLIMDLQTCCTPTNCAKWMPIDAHVKYCFFSLLDRQRSVGVRPDCPLRISAIRPSTLLARVAAGRGSGQIVPIWHRMQPPTVRRFTGGAPVIQE